MATTTDLGFSPEYFMPVIPPPVSGPYGTYTVTPDSLDPSDLNAGLKFTISSPSGATKHDNYLMVDGSITFVRATSNFPQNIGVLGGETADFNSIIIHINPVSSDVLKKHLPPGVPPAEFIIIENINESDFTTDLTNHLTAVANAASAVNSPFESSQFLKYLDIYWKESQGNTTGTTADKIDLLVDNVLSSDSQVACRAGLKLGSIINNVAGDAEFNIRMIESAGVELITPIAYLKNMDLLPDSTKGARWTSHPLKAALSSYATPLDIYLKFEIWNPLSLDDPSEPEYVPIDAGCEVQLMDYDQGAPVQVDSSLYTDSNGSVAFSFNPLPPGQSDPFPDLYFVIVSPESSKYSTYNNAHSPGITLPSEWSTKAATGTDNWFSVDGSPGYFENFSGFKLGKVTEPLTYRVGMDFHFRINYFDEFQPNNVINNRIIKSPQGIKVEVCEDISSENVLLTNLTNDDGELHGIIFDLEPQKNVFVKIYFELEVLSIKLKKTRIVFDALQNVNTTRFWKSSDINQVFFNNRFPSLRDLSKPNTPNAPIHITIPKSSDNLHAGLWFLKIVREIHEFLFYFTDGGWKGREMLFKMFHIFPNATATSYPNGSIWFTSDITNWSRGSIVHEYFHQVMWQQAEYTNGDIQEQFLWDGISTFNFYHRLEVPSNQNRALTEGWAYAIESIFSAIESNYNFELDLRDLYDLDLLGGLIGPIGTLFPSNNSDLDKGLIVEGAFGNAIYFTFWNHVVLSIISVSNFEISQSENGNILQSNSWMTSGNKASLSTLFKTLIWEPLTNLKNFPDWEDRTTFEYWFFTFFHNPSKEHLLLGETLRWNMMTENPEITSLSPSHGNAPGGYPIDILGERFAKQNTNNPFSANFEIEVLFGGTGISFSLIDSSKISIIIPIGSAGTSRNVQVINRINGFVVQSNTMVFSYDI